jgi:hypothetical protein
MGLGRQIGCADLERSVEVGTKMPFFLFVLGLASFLAVVCRIASATSSIPSGSPNFLRRRVVWSTIPDAVPSEWVDAYGSGAD